MAISDMKSWAAYQHMVHGHRKGMLTPVEGRVRGHTLMRRSCSNARRPVFQFLLDLHDTEG